MFFIFCAISIVIMAAGCFYASYAWSKYKNPIFGDGYILRSYNILSNVWPTDDGFLSLKFSAFRHCAVFILSAALIWYVNVTWFSWILLMLNLLYAYTVYLRYGVRLKDFKTAGAASRDMLVPVKNACFSILLISIAYEILLFTVYAFRP